MGPRFRKRGNHRRREGLHPRGPGFNGAALSEARKPGVAQSVEGRIDCGFNGAALSEARKPSWGRLPSAPGADQLQWGRAFGSAETQTGAGEQLLEEVLLQWGRAFGSAETPGCPPTWPAVAARFNGAALSEARKPHAPPAPPEPYKGFNGAALSEARKLCLWRWRVLL